MPFIAGEADVCVIVLSVCVCGGGGGGGLASDAYITLNNSIDCDGQEA